MTPAQTKVIELVKRIKQVISDSGIEVKYSGNRVYPVDSLDLPALRRAVNGKKLGNYQAGMGCIIFWLPTDSMGNALVSLD